MNVDSRQMVALKDDYDETIAVVRYVGDTAQMWTDTEVLNTK